MIDPSVNDALPSVIVNDCTKVVLNCDKLVSDPVAREAEPSVTVAAVASNKFVREPARSDAVPSVIVAD